jgi:hypothetical protein
MVNKCTSTPESDAMVGNSKSQIPSLKFQVSNSKSQIPSLKFQVSNSKSCFQCLLNQHTLVFPLGFGSWNLDLGIFINVLF